MKFKINSSDFVKKVKTVINGYDPAETSSYITFQINGNNELVIVAESISAYFRTKIPATNVELAEDEVLAYSVDGLTMKSLTTILPNAPIDLNFSFNNKMRGFQISYTGNKLTLPVLDENKELRKAPKVFKFGAINANEFLNSLKDSLKVVAKDNSAESLKCANLHFEDNKLIVVSSDSYVLLKTDLSFDMIDSVKERVNREILVKHNEIALLNTINNTNQILELCQGNGKFGFVDEEGTVILVSTSQERGYNYKAFLNQIEEDEYCIVEKANLKEAIDTISKLTLTTDYKEVAIDLDENMIASGENDNSIQVSVLKKQSEELKTKFSIEVLSKSINVVPTSLLKFVWGERKMPFKIVPMISEDAELGNITILTIPKVVN